MFRKVINALFKTKKSTSFDAKKLYSQVENIITNEATGRRFEKGKLIGKGGNGCCFKVRDLESNETFACKVSKKSEHSQKEANILKSSDHRNIVNYYGHFCDEKFLYVILECCDSSLHDVCLEKKKDVNLIQNYVHQIATVCHYLHTEKHIIHADLKPGNILLKDGVVKLTDFGHSRRLLSINEKRTHKGGTLVFMAPEIIMKQLCGVEIDCWALGCTIFQLLEGKAVLNCNNKEEIERIFFNNKFKVPLTSCSNANTLITGLLETNPELRYTMKDVLESAFVKESIMVERKVSIDAMPKTKKSTSFDVDKLYSQVEGIITNKATGRRFEKGKLLGKGRNGCCFKVHDMESNETFACKVLKKSRHSLYEAKMLKSLNHRNIVKYYEHFCDEKVQYIIMECCDSSLYDICLEKEIDVNLIRYYVRQIATACHYLHTEKYIVHADLKPENILLKDGVVKLADFGLSRKLSSVNEKLTHKGGTLVFKAPEIIMKQLCGVENDCWALGCTIFQLFEAKYSKENITSFTFKESKQTKLTTKVIDAMPKTKKSTSFDVNKLYSQVEGIITNEATGRRFEKGKLLGKGGNGCCFKVRDMESNETFACKASKKCKHSLYEANMLKSLNHRNIVKYYEHFCDEKVQYIIMECCDSSLFDICLEKKIDVNLIRYYVRQIATACHYLHTEKYIVHADLKPGNILLKDGVVKLADFGLSRKLSSVNEKLTHKGGTLVYMAPEIILKQLCGVEIDCWALGCTIFKLFEGKAVFTRKKAKKIEHIFINDTFKVPLTSCSNANTLITRLLETNPELRYTMKDVLKSTFVKEPSQCTVMVKRNFSTGDESVL
ncbi:PLK2, partial [Cordylochernes scorpioides]